MSSRTRRGTAQVSPNSPSPVAQRRSSRLRTSARRRSASASSSASRSASPPTTVRRSRASSATRTGRSSQGGATASSGVRARRPTPVAPRRNSNRLSDFIVDDSLGDQDDDYDQRARPETSTHSNATRQVSVQTGTSGTRASGRHSSYHRRTNQRCALDGSSLSWYERLIPECLLNMTAPITGYERTLDEMDNLTDTELELLERQRFRRNRRIRRRLMVIVVVASLASAYFIYRGRAPTSGIMGLRRAPSGVRETLGDMAHRFEDGLSKTIHDTMGK